MGERSRSKMTFTKMALLPLACLLLSLLTNVRGKHYLIQTKDKNKADYLQDYNKNEDYNAGNTASAHIKESKYGTDYGSSDISTDHITDWATQMIWNGTKKAKGVKLECLTIGLKNSRQCVFPFTYKGVKYETCIDTYSNPPIKGEASMIGGSYSRFWCATVEGYKENTEIFGKT